MDQRLSYILFEGSPFLPSIDEVSSHNIEVNVLQMNHIPAVSIAKELQYVGLKLHSLHLQDKEFLSFTYEADRVSLINYRLGFLSPLDLIVGANLMSYFPPKEVIAQICPPSTNEATQKYYNYKINLFWMAQDLFRENLRQGVLKLARSIYDLCRVDPFTDDPFFLIGLTASEELYTQYSNKLDYL